MAVVGFDDFDVVAFVQYAGDGVEDVEGQVYADTEIGGEHHADFFRRRFDGGFARVVKTRRADDDVFACLHAFLQVFERRLGAGKVD